MNKYEIIKRIENFAPRETAENWDCVGFMVETTKQEVSKVMICLTPTSDVVMQAKEQNCDLIISHHPLFFVPISWQDIDIYSAHTNMDRAHGGTTDTLINALGFDGCDCNEKNEFVRYAELKQPMKISEFVEILHTVSPNLRYVNNNNVQTVKKIGFCAGSGAEFINEAQGHGADCFVTGDLKFHAALDSEIVVFDIGHFESEVFILPVFKMLIGDEVNIIFAKETSPFNY